MAISRGCGGYRDSGVLSPPRSSWEAGARPVGRLVPARRPAGGPGRHRPLRRRPARPRPALRLAGRPAGGADPGGAAVRSAPRGAPRGAIVTGFAALALAVVAIGYPVQRDYLRDRFLNADAETSIPGMHLDSAYRWARGIQRRPHRPRRHHRRLPRVRLLRHRPLQPRALPRRRGTRTAPSTRSRPAPSSAPPSTPPTSTTWSPLRSSTSSSPASPIPRRRHAGCAASRR